MGIKVYVLNLIRVINETIKDGDWFEKKENLKIIYDAATKLKTETYMRM